MRGGNISNHQAPYVFFDIDSFLFREKEKVSVLDKIGDFFKSDEQKLLDRELDLVGIEMISRIFRKHNVCVGLVTFDYKGEDALYDLELQLGESNLPYTRLFSMEDWEDLRNCRIQPIYTFSANFNLLSYLSSNHALHISKVWEVFR